MFIVLDYINTALNVWNINIVHRSNARKANLVRINVLRFTYDENKIIYINPLKGTIYGIVLFSV